MRTDKRIKLVAILMIFVFIFTACGPKTDYKNPETLMKYYKQGYNVVGTTVAVKYDSDPEIFNLSGIIYSEGVDGSFFNKCVIFIENDEKKKKKGKTYAVKITNIRDVKSDTYIDGIILE